ncbi:hypothetical protein DB30_01334 [Enhygromyxa salina]|uniref:Uncharacterized protein n=1 Tax=Enhygromyxa salina TaxID=215803 RepID=A0A0C2CS44_9BACT|nr:hypothetical protein DB30_01334 [Enhygromyxa salina]
MVPRVVAVGGVFSGAHCCCKGLLGLRGHAVKLRSTGPDRAPSWSESVSGAGSAPVGKSARNSEQSTASAGR